ncbi:MAG: hypothetical protein KKC23_08835, partial [Proteobacteria bacterium]|nr:hypothetical protein [Pseudomonadota bacterium]
MKLLESLAELVLDRVKRLDNIVYFIRTSLELSSKLFNTFMRNIPGYTMLKKLFDQITYISRDISHKSIEQLGGEFQTGTDEILNIVQSFSAIENQFSKTFKQLQKKSSEISILKELSELCYVTFD